MKSLVVKGAILVLIAAVVVGCINPFGGGSDRAVSGSTVDIEVRVGDEFSASSIYDPRFLLDGPYIYEGKTYDEYWVEVEVFNDLGQHVTQEGMQLEGGVYRANLRVEIGLLTFIVTARLYDWDTDTSVILYYGEKDVNIVQGANDPISIGTSNFRNQAASVEVTQIPQGQGFEQVFVGVVSSTAFDVYAEIITPYIESGFSEKKLDELVGAAFIAAGETAIDGTSAEVYLTEWNMSRPWQDTGNYGVLVMFSNDEDMWIPGSFEGESMTITPFIGEVDFSSPNYFDTVNVSSVPEYQGFMEVVALLGGISVDVTGILQGSERFLEVDLAEMTDTTGDWQLLVAVFPASYPVFDNQGKLVDNDVEPFAMGFAPIDLDGDGKGSVVLYAGGSGNGDNDYNGDDNGDDNGNGNGDGGFPPLWQGTPGASYKLYVLLARDSDLDFEEMYIAGNEEVDVFIPKAFVFTHNFTFGTERQVVDVDVTGNDFVFMTGYSEYGYMVFDYNCGDEEDNLQTDVRLYADASKGAPSADFSILDTVDCGIEPGYYELFNAGSQSLVGVRFELADGTVLDSDVNTEFDVLIIMGKVDVSVLRGYYHFEWWFKTEHGDEIEGQYTGKPPDEEGFPETT